MKIRSVLLVYKKSVYQQFALEQKDPHLLRLLKKDKKISRQLKTPHQLHANALVIIEKSLKERGLHFHALPREKIRGKIKDDLVISVGGDGTFLETSHYMDQGLLMGVNSMPGFSVGYFCKTELKNFELTLDRILSDQAKIVWLHRLRTKINGRVLGPLVLNDILFTNINPAAISRYEIKVGSKKEEQRSSGLWISTAAGSTAAINSAGGQRLPLASSQFQYRIREPFPFLGRNPRLQGGLILGHQPLNLVSQMRHGALFFDGPHNKISLKRGDHVQVSSAKNPLKVLW